MCGSERSILRFVRKIAALLLFSQVVNADGSRFDSFCKLVDRLDHSLTDYCDKSQADEEVEDRCEAIHWQPHNEHVEGDRALHALDNRRDLLMREEEIVFVSAAYDCWVINVDI